MALQSPAERDLIAALIKALHSQPHAHILNLGANQSIVIETELARAGLMFTADRADIVDCSLSTSHPWLGQSYQASAEDLKALPDNRYDAVFANFVFEHIENLGQSAREVSRILKPGGIFVTSIPNPRAPEFVVSKHTPHAFHQLVRGHAEGHEHHAHETHYAYASIEDFTHHFTAAGLMVQHLQYRAATYVYLHRFPLINLISKAYDWSIEKIGAKRLLGAVCVVFKK